MTEVKTFFKDPKYTRKKKKKGKTKEEREYLNKIASMPCIACGVKPVQVHHITGAGMGLRASHFETLPLCPEHHLGDTGVHKSKKAFEATYGTQEELLEEVRKRIK